MKWTNIVRFASSWHRTSKPRTKLCCTATKIALPPLPKPPQITQTQEEIKQFIYSFPKPPRYHTKHKQQLYKTLNDRED
jgi:hypothetical protein